MRYLPIIFSFCYMQSIAQITGNPHVVDSSAIQLDAKAVSTMMGKWKLVRTEDHFQNEERVNDRGMIIDFEEDGAMISSWCVGCHQETLGQWQVLDEQTIKLDNNRAEEATKFLAGEWVVYKLTEQEMILAKVLTSSGDWKKFQYYSRDIGSPPLTKADPYCINCLGGSWCFGDRPEEAKRQWFILDDLIKSDGKRHQHKAEILKKYDWLLNNAPCITSLYINAVKYYEGLLRREKNKQVAKSYREKIKQIKEQQQLYFKN